MVETKESGSSLEESSNTEDDIEKVHKEETFSDETFQPDMSNIGDHKIYSFAEIGVPFDPGSDIKGPVSAKTVPAKPKNENMSNNNSTDKDASDKEFNPVKEGLVEKQVVNSDNGSDSENAPKKKPTENKPAVVVPAKISLDKTKGKNNNNLRRLPDEVEIHTCR